MANEKRKPLSRFSAFFQRLQKNQSGLAVIEFAFSMPVLMGLGMYGTETANFALANMKVSQAALNLADNASRLGQTDNGIATPTITESDVMQVLAGTIIQSENIDLAQNGRIILSSLEVTGTQQFIRWQRCKGIRNITTSYDDDTNDNGVTDTSFTGMGAPGAVVRASANSAVMFVEVEYSYQGLFGDMFIGERVLRQEAAFNIRDDRNLTAGLANDVDTPSTIDPETNAASNAASCLKFDAT